MVNKKESYLVIQNCENMQEADSNKNNLSDNLLSGQRNPDHNKQFSSTFGDQKLFKMMCLINDSLSAIIWVKDLDGRYLHVNREYCSKILLSDDINEPIGKHPDYLFQRLKQEQPDNYQWYTIGDSFLKSDEYVYNYKKKLTVITKGYIRGEQRVYELHKIPFFDDNGRFIGLIGTGTDITERHQAEHELLLNEERLQLAMIGASLGVWDLDLIKGKLFIDSRWVSYYGYGVDDFRDDFSFFKDHIHPDDLAGYEASMADFLSQKTHLQDIDFRIITKDGQIRWVKSVGTIVEFTEKGFPSRLVGIHQDITERKIQEQLLDEVRHKAEESDRLKTAFLANLSHEIRTPLNSILGFTKFLVTEDNLPYDMRQEYMGIVEESSENFLQIINNIIDMAKIETGNFRLEHRIFDLPELCIEIISKVKRHFSYHDKINLTFSYDQGDHPGTKIVSDRNVFEQVIFNLLSNAVKFTKEGDVELGYELVGSDRLFLFVRDSGIGINLKSEKIIYQPFRQLNESFKREYGGAGLGLAIAFRMVEILNGKLWFESEEGKGTIFYVYIPLESD